MDSLRFALSESADNKTIGYACVLRWQHKTWVYYAADMNGVIKFLKTAFEKDFETPKITQDTATYLDSRGKEEVATFDNFTSILDMVKFFVRQHRVEDSFIHFGPIKDGLSFQEVNAHTLS